MRSTRVNKIGSGSGPNGALTLMNWCILHIRGGKGGCIKPWWEICIILCFNESFMIKMHRTKFCKVHESPGHEPIWSTKSKDNGPPPYPHWHVSCMMHPPRPYPTTRNVGHWMSVRTLGLVGHTTLRHLPMLEASTRIDNFLHYYRNHQFIYRLGRCRHRGSSACDFGSDATQPDPVWNSN